ncbi:glycerophosphoryl diester phosphodiesterase [Alkalibacillus flavidus]|uniref:Glycerophosphoryl diester phosphodiesterase n=1 Tax=Alkalibacillus flavidus TaxID=546021 RepID=A0ABV2KS67_9BACI
MTICTKIFAHRGASRYAPENTMAAFKRAYHLGADGIELDVHLTRDHQVAVIHDENIKRTTNHSGLVNHFSLSELQRLDAGSWFHSQYNGEKIPSLEDVLQWIQHKHMTLNIELKTDVIHYHQIEEHVVSLIHKYNLEKQTILSSFNPATIERLNLIQSDIELAWLRQKRLKNIAYQLAAIGADSLHIHHRLLNTPMIQEIKSKQIPFRVYTVNKPKIWRQCVSQRANGIMTDIPDLLQE